mmetsp:Transcript_41/g.54  ORF Transcript_41/g.54 Transcript_41/m.54 type:complete len:96 (-) Transcript_41:86-373(-)
MPLNKKQNRVSTSLSLKTHDIWKSAIGHDPYAADVEREEDSTAQLNKEKAKTLLKIARSQNVEGRRDTNASVDDFAKKMFLGLKSGKKKQELKFK